MRFAEEANYFTTTVHPANSMGEIQAIVCLNPKCGAVIGKIIEVEGLEWLQMGGGIARQWHGVCAKCGKEFHWSVSDRLLEKLISKIVNFD